ncbi:MAG: glycosyltransferase family 1 protein, partial [Proteobacteria bacterium]|nr:glycosyltransferase family 1 protein [Pseudomonadota bacterium]
VLPSNMELIKARTRWISLSEQIELPSLLRRLRADLFHSPSFVAPFYSPCKTIMTIHDLNHMVLPQFYTPFHQVYYSFFVKRCIRRSEAILTVSRFSRDEIVRTLKLPPEKVAVTYNGVSPNYRRVTDPETLQYVRDIYELPERFVFCLTNNKPHKNVHQLVRAYSYSGLKLPLVLACPFDSGILSVAEQYGKKHLVFFSKFINEEHLPAVYSLTDLFVYPSTYEGFGLPPLEAMACGAPVVVARSSSLPEVVGDLAIFANPFDYQDMARALREGIEDTTARARMQDNGLMHALQFSWQQMARQTLAIYEACGRGSNVGLVDNASELEVVGGVADAHWN